MAEVTRCEHFIEKKQRRCGMLCKRGLSVCTEHSRKDGNPDRGARVACPLDPKHTVWEANLRKHLLKCNQLKMRHLNDNEAYYVENFNSARCTGFAGETGGMHGIGDIDTLILQAIPIIEKICGVRFPDQLPLDVRSNDFMQNGRFNQLITNKKHAVQQSSLIQHLVDRELTRNTSFVEFGCGRAELSRYVNQVVTSRTQQDARQHFVLVDRASNRMKFDKKIRDDYAELANCHGVPHQLTYRYKIDIKDLKLDAVLREDGYVAISKHLCGVATDLTLRCIANSEKLTKKAQLQGLCIAMCCRHVCEPEEYVNREYIEEMLTDYGMDYTPFFRALQKICSWATCGRKPGIEDDDVNNHFTQLTVKKRESLGFMARRIIDQGRYQWVKATLSKEYKVELVRYVTTDVSLENVAMLIHKKL